MNEIGPAENPTPRLSRPRRAVGVVLLFLIGLWFGWWLRGSPNQVILNAFLERTTGLGGPSSELNVFSTVWKTIDETYVDRSVDASQLLEGAIAGMVANLGDPYSVYLNPTDTKEFKSDIQGNFEGIGAEVGLKDGAIVVIAPLPESPAARAGLRSGDRILEIDGTSTTGLALDEAVERLRGPKGSEVALHVRSEAGEERDITITRDVIVVRSVSVERRPVNDGSEETVALITIAHFTDSTTRELREAVTDLLVNPPRGIILDLRNNPGGYLQSAIDVAGLFLTEGSTVLLEERVGQRIPSRSKGKGELSSLPTAVLINGGTASAAEILAGALRDERSIRLVGEATFGKGSVQDFIDLENGGSLKLTVARWLTPLGRSIDQAGLEPDLAVSLTEEAAAAGRDAQLERALNELTTDRES